MKRGRESGVVRGIRAGRSAGPLPLVAAVMSAAALTGAAFYTVNQASCADSAKYIRHDNRIELVGGCVNPSELPATPPKDISPAAPIGLAELGD